MDKDSYIGHCKLLKTNITKDIAQKKSYSFLNTDVSTIKISDDLTNNDLLQYIDADNIKKDNK